ncbi:MAG: FAD binding domain-containing protein [Acidobacteriota bacterium]
MKSFEYASPQTKEDAVKLLGSESVALAGGTDILNLMKDYVSTPQRLVNLKTVEELGGIRDDSGGGVRIGALVTLDEMLASDRIKREYPAIWGLSERMGGPQIRSVGTVGGNLCQRPRCWYYRNGFGLLALRNGKSMVLEGDDRYHAVLGNEGPAYFVSPSTLAPALIALDSQVRLFGPNGAREVRLEDFYVIPKADGENEFVLQPNEIVTEVIVPSASNRKNAIYEVRQRQGLDWPLVSAAVSLEMDGNQVRNARVVLGQVAPKPWVASDAQSFLSGKSISAEVAEQAGEAAVRGATALNKNAYKIRLARVAVKRALLRATGTEV